MQKTAFYSFILLAFSFFCSSTILPTRSVHQESITKIEMDLSAFGVESDNFPSIQVYIDFINDSNSCNKSYYNPKFKPSTYKLSSEEIKKVLQLFQAVNLEQLKPEYRVGKSDQPTSTTTIYTTQKKIIIKDYGLEGDYPLKEVYRIVYKY